MTIQDPAAGSGDLLVSLLARGDALSIERGRLIILPASGKPVPDDWLAKNHLQLTRQILQAVGMDAFHYLSYSTGRYGRKKAEGVEMQFQNVTSLAGAYVVFNVELTRSRTTKAGNKGTELPPGRFRIGKRHKLYKFWLTTGLTVPASLAALHDYMGNLRGILISASPAQDREDNRLDKDTLQALNLSATAIQQAVLAQNSHTAATQHPHSSHTTMPHKESAPAQQPCGLQPFSSTGENNHGKAVIRESGNTVIPFSPAIRKTPQEQTTDEWLADYDSQPR